MSYRKGFILALGLLALGAASAHAQDDRYRKTSDDRYGDDERYGDDGRLHKDDGYYEDDVYYGDEGSRGQGRAMNARFRGMDRNRDGRITRDEWRGNEQSFRVQDKNGDGILAGREVRANNARRKNGNRNTDTRVDSLGTLDRNRDGVISRGEWSGSRSDFDRLDRNRDGYLTSSEADYRY